jgi:hypothetical protein
VKMSSVGFMEREIGVSDREVMPHLSLVSHFLEGDGNAASRYGEADLEGRALFGSQEPYRPVMGA